MNLTNMLEDNSINNLSWLENKETFMPQDKDNNKRDDLEIEWGEGMDIGKEMPKPTTINDEMKIKTPPQDPFVVVNAARILLNQGIMGHYLLQQLKSHFTIEQIKQAVSELRKLLCYEGIIGSVAIDLRGLKNHSEAIKASVKSPFKRHIACVLMTSKEALNSDLVEHRDISSSSSKIGSIDGLFDSNEIKKEQLWYKPLKLPVFIADGGHVENIDNEFVDRSIIELSNLGEIDDKDIEEIKSCDDPNEKIKKAFHLAFNKKIVERKKNGSEFAKDKSSEFNLESKMTVSVNSKPEKFVKQAVNEVKKSLEDIEINPEDKKETQLVKEVKKSLEDIEIDKNSQEDLDINLVNKNPIQPFELEGVNNPDLDIDPAPFIDEEFEGADNIDLEEEKKFSNLDVNITPDFNIE